MTVGKILTRAFYELENSPVIASTSAFQNLGNLGGNYAVVTSLNNRGQAVGWSKNASGLAEGFLIQPNGSLQSLEGLLFYYGVKNISHAVIMDEGKIVGTGLCNETGVGWTQRGFVIAVIQL